MNTRDLIQDPHTVLVDVRTVAEYATGHVAGSLNIPLDQLPARTGEIPGLGQLPVVFYCRSGSRSGQAVAWLKQKGYSKVFNGGGLDEVKRVKQKA